MPVCAGVCVNCRAGYPVRERQPAPTKRVRHPQTLHRLPGKVHVRDAPQVDIGDLPIREKHAREFSVQFPGADIEWQRCLTRDHSCRESPAVTVSSISEGQEPRIRMCGEPRTRLAGRDPAHAAGIFLSGLEDTAQFAGRIGSASLRQSG